MFIVGWIVLSLLIWGYASSKGRFGFGWFLLSLIISPLITFIILAVSGPPGVLLKKCPKCAEQVKIEALICRFCGFEFLSNKDKEQMEKEIEKLKGSLMDLNKTIQSIDSVSQKKELTKERDQVEYRLNQFLGKL